MIYFKIMFSLSLLLASQWCVAAQTYSDSRMVPPDFEEVNFGKVVYKDRMLLSVDSPCGLSSSSVVGGLWEKLTLNIFRADVTRDYRGKHRGDFNGAYTPCGGSGGSGSPVLPVWKGAANAGKKYVAPMAIDVLFIRSDSISRQAQAILSCYASYRTKFGFPPPIQVSLAIAALIEALYQTANWEPPGRFSGETDFQTSLISTNEYRMIDKASIRYDVDKDGKIDRSDFFAEAFINGWTTTIPKAVRPLPSPDPNDLAYIPSDIDRNVRMVDPTAERIILKRENYTRVGVEGYIVALVGGSVPNVWDKMLYTAKADGTFTVAFTVSFFPTHRFYESRNVDSSRRQPTNYRTRTTFVQEDAKLGVFIYETGWFVDVAPHFRGVFTLSGNAFAL